MSLKKDSAFERCTTESLNDATAAAGYNLRGRKRTCSLHAFTYYFQNIKTINRTIDTFYYFL